MYFIVSRRNCSLHKRAQTHVGTMARSLTTVPRLAFWIYSILEPHVKFSRTASRLTSRTFESIRVSGSRHDPTGLRRRPLRSSFVWEFEASLSVRETNTSEAQFPLRRQDRRQPSYRKFYAQVCAQCTVFCLLAGLFRALREKTIFFCRVLLSPSSFFQCHRTNEKAFVLFFERCVWHQAAHRKTFFLTDCLILMSTGIFDVQDSLLQGKRFRQFNVRGYLQRTVHY